jgi:membrane protein YqaA with SNARE-associated domain
MLDNLIYNFGYVGLFILTFLASTLIPLGSEAFVILTIALNYNPIIVLLVATVGNSLGSVTNYYIGKYGNKFFLSKYIHPDSKYRKKAEKLYKRFGAPILFFSWLPGIGDPLCIIPGALGVSLRKFSFWVFLGKFARFSVLIAFTLLVKSKFF